MNDFSDQLVERMLASESVVDRFSALTKSLSCIGIDTVNYAIFSPDANNFVETDVQFLTTMSQDWMDYYYDKNLATTDYHVGRILAGNICSYVFSESSIVRVGDAHRRTLEEGAEAGLRSTLCVPLAGPHEPFKPIGAINLGTSLSEREFRMIMGEHGPALASIAHLFHTASVREVWRDRIGYEALSVRERDCLQYVAAGLRQDAIADVLNLAIVTVELHLRRARQKLGARTLGEVVAKALLYGEIKQG